MTGHPRQQSEDDGKLVLAALDGDAAAFDVLVGRYQRRAVALALRLLSNRDDAMEVAQDAFLRAYDRLDSLSQPERFGSWLLRIVSNLSLNRRRSRALRKHAPLDSAAETDDAPLQHADERAFTPLEDASGAELKTMLERLIAQLPEMQRQALLLFAIEKMPQKEVARMLGCSVEAVKWHVFTARKKLKDQLKDYL